MTENYGAFGFENQVYKYQLDPISYCNNTVYSSVNSAIGSPPFVSANNTGYFWVNDATGTNGIRTKSAGTALYSSISNRGDVKFGLQSNKLYVDLVLPKGGKFSFDVYDIMGRRLDVSSPEQEYKEGRHKMSYDMTQTSTGIYIIHYKINGEKLSIKLGMLD
jgi:hypothetical protein